MTPFSHKAQTEVTGDYLADNNSYKKFRIAQIKHHFKAEISIADPCVWNKRTEKKRKERKKTSFRFSNIFFSYLSEKQISFKFTMTYYLYLGAFIAKYS